MKNHDLETAQLSSVIGGASKQKYQFGIQVKGANVGGNVELEKNNYSECLDRAGKDFTKCKGV